MSNFYIRRPRVMRKRIDFRVKFERLNESDDISTTKPQKAHSLRSQKAPKNFPTTNLQQKSKYQTKGKAPSLRCFDKSAPRFDSRPQIDSALGFDSEPRIFSGPRTDSEPRFDSGPQIYSGPGFDSRPRIYSGPEFDSRPRFDSVPRIANSPDTPNLLMFQCSFPLRFVEFR